MCVLSRTVLKVILKSVPKRAYYTTPKIILTILLNLLYNIGLGDEIEYFSTFSYIPTF